MSEMTLTGSQKRQLKAVAHHLKALVLIGKEGASKGFESELDAQLKIHELMKVRILNNCLDSPEIVKQAIERTGAVVLQQVGHVITVFRKRHGDSAFPEI